ncbi:DUF551 domain-containing protein [Enterobacter cloacae]
MNQVTIEQVRERLTYLEGLNARGVGTKVSSQQFEIACLRKLLESLEAKPVAFINGAREPVLYGEHIRIAIATHLYTAPPIQMLEIENLEHFISFWKKVQAGQMKPGKNDIDHMVWFLEGLSNLTTLPAPVSVPDEATPENIEILASTFAPCGVTYQWDRDECNAAADSWNACRDAMLQGADGNSPVIPDGWVACSERLPENKPGSYEYLVFEGLNNRVQHDYWNVPDAGDDCQFTPFWNHYGRYVTHWMPLPAAPRQEVK